MADQDQPPGRLIAIDGSRGKDTAAAADAVVAALKHQGIECAISRWDASGLFGDLAAAANDNRNISPRTLALVYAADLAFRLRWEIKPVLEAGGVVVAAPYVETAATLGTACGLGEEWVRQLLRFAPRPDLRGRALERKIDKAWKARTDRGYPEFCAALLGKSAPKAASKRARRDMMALLDRPHGRKVFRLTDKGAASVAKAVTDSRKAASRRSPSRPRNGRK
jgi:hypothetical protein